MNEKEIISLWQKWDLTYFWELYEKYVDEIYKFIYLKTYDTDLSQDITSQVFFKVMDKIKLFKNDNDSNFRAWIYKIAYNLVIDNYKNTKEDISIDDTIEAIYKENFADNLDNKEKLKKIFTYFDTLNPKHKEVLILRIWDDLSFKEISVITKMTESNCKKIVSRTLQNIPPDLFVLWILLFLIK